MTSTLKDYWFLLDNTNKWPYHSIKTDYDFPPKHIHTHTHTHSHTHTHTHTHTLTHKHTILALLQETKYFYFRLNLFKKLVLHFSIIITYLIKRGKGPKKSWDFLDKTHQVEQKPMAMLKSSLKVGQRYPFVMIIRYNRRRNIECLQRTKVRWRGRGMGSEDIWQTWNIFIQRKKYQSE